MVQTKSGAAMQVANNVYIVERPCKQGTVFVSSASDS